MASRIFCEYHQLVSTNCMSTPRCKTITNYLLLLILIVINLGAIIQSTLDDEQTSTHAMALSEITAKASHIVGLLNNNQDNDELTFLRIRSKQREIMVCTRI